MVKEVCFSPIKAKKALENQGSAGLEPAFALLTATSDLAALRLAKSRVFSCSLDASILQAKTKNVANHDVLMVRANRRKRTKKQTRDSLCILNGEMAVTKFRQRTCFLCRFVL